MHIVTSRLILREFVLDDLEAMVQYESDPSVVQYVCYGPASRETCAQELNFHLQQQYAEPRTFFHLALVPETTHQMIGWCGIDITSRQHQHGELGYALQRAHWGKGYMTEAVQAIITAGFRDLGLHRIYATCDPQNVGSMRVLEKAGMHFEGMLREHLWCKGRWRSSRLYALIASDMTTEQAPGTGSG